MKYPSKYSLPGHQCTSCCSLSYWKSMKVEMRCLSVSLCFTCFIMPSISGSPCSGNPSQALICYGFLPCSLACIGGWIIMAGPDIRSCSLWFLVVTYRSAGWFSSSGLSWESMWGISALDQKNILNFNFNFNDIIEPIQSII